MYEIDELIAEGLKIRRNKINNILKLYENNLKLLLNEYSSLIEENEKLKIENQKLKEELKEYEFEEYIPDDLDIIELLYGYED